MFVCLPFWLYRESICYFLFMRGVFSPYVEWRAGTYKLKFGGTGVRVEPSGKSGGVGKPGGPASSPNSRQQRARRARKRHVQPKKPHPPPQSIIATVSTNTSSPPINDNQREIKIDASIPNRFGSSVISSSATATSGASCSTTSAPDLTTTAVVPNSHVPVTAASSRRLTSDKKICICDNRYYAFDSSIHTVNI